MRSIRKYYRHSVAYLAVQGTLLWHASHVLAQDTPQSQGKEDWVFSYALVGLSIGLGLFVVCRMGKRSQEVKPARP